MMLVSILLLCGFLMPAFAATAQAKLYTEQTGVEVTVLTAAPTLFQVNGPVGLQSWKDYCYDLTGTQVAGELTSDDFLLKNGEEIAGVSYVIETQGCHVG